MIVDLILYQMTILTASFPSCCFFFFFHVINWNLVELAKSVTALTLMIFLKKLFSYDNIASGYISTPVKFRFQKSYSS